MRNQPKPHEFTQAMADTLSALNPECSERFMQVYQEPDSDSTYTHIEHANSFWRLQLGRQSISTTNVRECLLNNCSPEDWLRLFRTTVAPAAVSLNLPQ